MEYKKILRLTEKDRMRDTLYSEMLGLISSYGCGLAAMVKEQSEHLGRKQAVTLINLKARNKT